MSKNTEIFLNLINEKGRGFVTSLIDHWLDNDSQYVEIYKNGVLHFKNDREKETDFSKKEVIEATQHYDAMIEKADEIYLKARQEFEQWYRESEFYKKKSFRSWQDFSFYNGCYTSDLTQIIFLAFLKTASAEALAPLAEQK
ncbi:hypothetical protein [Acinetobacter colistiniresistens]|nr:hypothetical protein [Acinetobacter colistiniresistens]